MRDSPPSWAGGWAWLSLGGGADSSAAFEEGVASGSCDAGAGVHLSPTRRMRQRFRRRMGAERTGRESRSGGWCGDVSLPRLPLAPSMPRSSYAPGSAAATAAAPARVRAPARGRDPARGRAAPAAAGAACAAAARHGAQSRPLAPSAGARPPPCSAAAPPLRIAGARGSAGCAPRAERRPGGALAPPTERCRRMRRRRTCWWRIQR